MNSYEDKKMIELERTILSTWLEKNELQNGKI